MPIAVIVRFMPRFFLRLPPESMEPRRCPEPPPTSEVVRDMAFGISPPDPSWPTPQRASSLQSRCRAVRSGKPASATCATGCTRIAARSRASTTPLNALLVLLTAPRRQAKS